MRCRSLGWIATRELLDALELPNLGAIRLADAEDERTAIGMDAQTEEAGRVK